VWYLVNLQDARCNNKDNVYVEVTISSHTVTAEVHISNVRILVRRYAMSSGKQLPPLRTVPVPPSSGSSKDFVFTSRYGAMSYKTGTFNTNVITLCTFWCLYSSREIVCFQEFHYTKYKTYILVLLTIGEACMVTRLNRNKVKECMWYTGGTCEQSWP